MFVYCKLNYFHHSQIVSSVEPRLFQQEWLESVVVVGNALSQNKNLMVRLYACHAFTTIHIHKRVDGLFVLDCVKLW